MEAGQHVEKDGTLEEALTKHSSDEIIENGFVLDYTDKSTPRWSYKNETSKGKYWQIRGDYQFQNLESFNQFIGGQLMGTNENFDYQSQVRKTHLN